MNDPRSLMMYPKQSVWNRANLPSWEPLGEMLGGIDGMGRKGSGKKDSDITQPYQNPMSYTKK
ncbi:hypothetical protein VK70_19535 [Paenibacillus durus ATCC 35681]|uniref:Uncharacterized protein n=1 Tax=Paenibacillus durus ATCC 35681 TaxID=1333534 RepID=A0A0F7FCK2_PAEDU|nr:hypothetical protein VK70_19535 [Paenibacillus durus ATCC 35681]